MADAPASALHPDPGNRRLTLRGAWTLDQAASLTRAVDGLGSQLPAGPWQVDASGVTGLDTVGALLLLRALRPSGLTLDGHTVQGLEPGADALLRLVASRLTVDQPIADRRSGFGRILWRLGRAVVELGRISYEFLGFVGLVLASMGRTLLNPRRLRLTSTVFHMEEIGLDAVPIVALLTFLVGAVVAFVGATALRDLGAEIFTVELVSISFLREFAVLLTAILLAGRSGSAFAAQIGSMKSREELDAIQAIGLDPVDLLVIPRLVALLVMLPLLTFIAMLAGILGGGLVAVVSLDITPGMFVSRLNEMTELRHFFVGMVKAPVFAFLIATIGCLEGFKVTGSAESVGQHTTSAVVQSIFMVIVFDALFAMSLMELGI